MLKFKAALTKFGTTPPAPISRGTMTSWNSHRNHDRAAFVHLNAGDVNSVGLYFGLEMELPFHPILTPDRENIWRWYNQPETMNLLNDIYKCVYPFGTCYFDSGIETVTSPASYLAQKRILKFFWSNFGKLGYNLRNEEYSGNHVHISAAAFKNNAHTLRFWRVFNRDAFAQLRASVMQRNPETMPAVPDIIARRNLEEYLSCGRTGATALNTEHETHEVRIFRHPTSYLEAAKNLDFVKSVYDFTSVVDVEEPTLAEYREFLAGMDSSYPDLREFWDRKKPRASVRISLAAAASAETQRLSA